MGKDIARHHIEIFGTMWRWPIFTWLLDVAIHNARLLSKKSGRTYTKLQFKREIVSTYLTKYRIPGK